MWLSIAPAIRADIFTGGLTDVTVASYKNITFQALTVWARQYAHMLVDSINPRTKAKDIFYPFATVATSKKVEQTRCSVRG